MKSDVRRELIPRDEIFPLLSALSDMRDKLLAVAKQSNLQDDTGHAPAAPSYTDLLQHAADAQALARDVVQLTADFARRAHSTTRAGSAVLRHLTTATSMSSHAAPSFAEAAEAALSLSLHQSSDPTDRNYQKRSVVIDHSTARAYLRFTSDSLRDAVKELEDHLDVHRFSATPTQQASPAPPQPKPSPRRR